MSMNEIRERAEALRQLIRHHDQQYYVLASPGISDFEYDKLFAELQAIESAHPELASPESPTLRAASRSGFRARMPGQSKSMGRSHRLGCTTWAWASPS